MTQSHFPDGWDEERVRRALERYEGRSPEVSEDEAAYESTTYTTMEVPTELVPQGRTLVARRRAS